MSIDATNLKAGAWDANESYFAGHAARKHVPMYGSFELTSRCNFSCKMCYIHTAASLAAGAAPMGELSVKEWLRLAEEALKSGTLYLLLTGGEPLIRDDFEEIYTEVSKMGFMVRMNTNASLVSEKYAGLFAKYPPTSISATLYGADRGTYADICGNPDFFDQTIRGLERLSGVPTVLQINTTFIKNNMHQLERIREIANRYTKRFAINPMVFKAVPGVISSAELCRMSAKECFDLVDLNKAYYQRLEKETAPDIDAIPLKNENEPKKQKYRGLDVPPEALTCLASKATYWIRCDGKMLPCGTFAAPYTLPLEEGFQAAWDRLPGLLSGLKYPDKCQACEYYDNCPNCLAYFQVETGSFDQVPEYICELARERNQRYKATV